MTARYSTERLYVLTAAGHLALVATGDGRNATGSRWRHYAESGIRYYKGSEVIAALVVDGWDFVRLWVSSRRPPPAAYVAAVRAADAAFAGRDGDAFAKAYLDQARAVGFGGILDDLRVNGPGLPPPTPFQSGRQAAQEGLPRDRVRKFFYDPENDTDAAQWLEGYDAVCRERLSALVGKRVGLEFLDGSIHGNFLVVSVNLDTMEATIQDGAQTRAIKSNGLVVRGG